jgi:MFS family permease
MDDIDKATLAQNAARRRTVQEYIDEIPMWPDGTQLTKLPLTGMQWRIWGLAIAGKFFEGLVVFMTGVALPLIDKEFSLHTADHSLITASTLAGILIGATVLGNMADTFGRKTMFIVEMVLFTAFLVALVFSPGFIWLVICLFGIGIALGCDYPTAHMVISEAVPSRGRGGLVLGAFAFQSIGAICGAGLGYIVLSIYPQIDAWRWMYAAAIIPAVLVVAGRFFVCDSAHWLVSRGRLTEAEAETKKLLRREPQYPKTVELLDPHVADHGGREDPSRHLGVLFDASHLRATLLASVPWFLQDLSTYGIGIFTPVILGATLGSAGAAKDVPGLVHKVLLSAQGTAMVDVLLVVGVLAAILMVERAGRIKLQIIGFIGCAFGLALAALSAIGGHNLPLLFAGFMIFNFMTNMGPNAQTYLLAGEVFPTAIRGYGAGFAASFAKIGAVLTAFFFPILLKAIGTPLLLLGLIIASLLGAVTTAMWSVETRGALKDVSSRIQPQV